MNIADYIIIGIIIVAAAIGFYKGLLNTLYKLVSYILAVYLSFKLAKPVSVWFQETSIYTKLNSGVVEFVNKLGLNFDGLESINPENISKLIKEVPLPQSINQSISGIVSAAGKSANNMLDSFVGTITDLVLLILCGLILFVIFKVLFSLFGLVIKGMAELPIIKQFDKLGGGVLGIVIGIIIVYVIGLLLTFFVANETLQPVFEVVNNSAIAKLLYNNNILVGLLGL